jgi:hypothetical protein
LQKINDKRKRNSNPHLYGLCIDHIQNLLESFFYVYGIIQNYDPTLQVSKQKIFRILIVGAKRKETEMIENFETVKKELRELAGVINTFKSEAVQLRIVELILGASAIQKDQIPAKETVSQKPKRKKQKAATKSADVAGKKGKKKATAAGTGAVATLSQLAEGDFFSKPRTINDIIQHCSTSFARKFKANEFSSKLGRMVRNGKLTRKKNADNQYEYTKA